METGSGALDKRVSILGIPISVVRMHSALARIDYLTRQPAGSYVCVTDVYNIMLAQQDANHREVLNKASMITPDGKPLSVVAKLRGCEDIGRVCGPDMMLEAMKESSLRKWKHFFLGGAEHVPALLSERMREAYPGVEIVGTYSPPFRPLTEAEDDALMDRIRNSGANILWIGLGCPKQERWMAEHVSKLPGIVQIGVGAAFNFHVGEVARAPKWMQTWGLEWLHRLVSEPKRLWRRYLIYAPRFATLALLETFQRDKQSEGTQERTA